MPKNTKSAVVLVIGVLVLLGAYFGVYSQYSNWGLAKDELAVSQLANDKLEQAKSEADAFMAKYETNREQAEVANRVLPLGDADVPILLGNMSQILGESGMTVNQMNILDDGKALNAETVPGTIQTIDMNVQVSGSYEAFNNLLLRLQRNRRLMDLVSMNISQNSEDASGNSLKFALIFRTYYQQ